MSASPAGLQSLLLSFNQKTDATVPDQDKVIGTLVGAAVGDALGAPLEFHSRASVRRQYPEPLREMVGCSTWAAGEYTDDTQMALCLAESLAACGELIPAESSFPF